MSSILLTFDVQTDGVALPVPYSVAGNAGVEAPAVRLRPLHHQGPVAHQQAPRHVLS
jgi:hypothetical protein